MVDDERDDDDFDIKKMEEDSENEVEAVESMDAEELADLLPLPSRPWSRSPTTTPLVVAPVPFDYAAAARRLRGR